MLPIFILVSKGIFKIVGDTDSQSHPTLKSLVVLSLVFFLTFPLIDTYLTSNNLVLTIILSILIWVILSFINTLSKSWKVFRLKFKVGSKSSKTIITIVLSTVLLVSGFITIQHNPYSKGFRIWRARDDLYNEVSTNTRKDRVIISAGGQIGLYYFTGISTLSIIRGTDPDSLAILRPFFEAPDIDEGLRFLIHDLKVGAFIFRAEQGGFYREWYVYLLNELPELRILYNPQLFRTVLYSPKYFYFLNLVNDSWRSYGVLDVVVRGSNPSEESSLFLPYDYDVKHTVITQSREGLNLSVLLYFPRSLIEGNVGKAASFEVSTNLTIKTKVTLDHWLETTKKIETRAMLNLSKTVQLNVGTIYGKDDSLRTIFRIDSIEIKVGNENFDAYFKLVPGRPTTFPGTWLSYFPMPEPMHFNFPKNTWTHSGSNLIEIESFLERCSMENGEEEGSD